MFRIALSIEKNISGRIRERLIMARTKKEGLSYFPFDGDFYHSPKIRLLKAKFGFSKIGILTYLYAEIYFDKGYYLELDEDKLCLIEAETETTREEILELLEFFHKHQMLTIDNSLERKDGSEVYILSGINIQEQYHESCKHRKVKFKVDPLIWKIPPEKTEKHILLREESLYRRRTKPLGDTSLFPFLKDEFDSSGIIPEESQNNPRIFTDNPSLKEKKRKEKKSNIYRLSSESEGETLNTDGDKVQTETKPKQKKKDKEIYGEFQNVYLTNDEAEKIKEKWPGLFEDIVFKLGSYKASKGRKYKSDYGAICQWVAKSVLEEQEKHKPWNNSTMTYQEADRLRQKEADDFLTAVATGAINLDD